MPQMQRTQQLATIMSRILCSTFIILHTLQYVSMPVEALKSAKHRRLKGGGGGGGWSPEQLLKEHAEIALPTNVNISTWESSYVAWQGAQHNVDAQFQHALLNATFADIARKNDLQQEQQQQQRRQRKKKQKQKLKEQRKHKGNRHVQHGKVDAVSAGAGAANAKATTATTPQQEKRSKKKQRQLEQKPQPQRPPASRGKPNKDRNQQQQQQQQQRRNVTQNALRSLNSTQQQLSAAAITAGNNNKHNNNGAETANGNDDGGGGGLFPQPFNVAMRATITVNATCGQSGNEEYCKLDDVYPHKKWANQCGTCNAHSSDPTKHRPIEAIIAPPSSTAAAASPSASSSVSVSAATAATNYGNGHEKGWWQSPTLQYGRHFEYVTITLDLKQVYEVFSMMLRSANSPRPASWILERSLDGDHYEPWQYFGLSDADCRRRYGLAAKSGRYVFNNESEVICTTQFSKAVPLESGEMHISLVKNRPGAQEQSAAFLAFIRARYIRIRLQGMHTTANLDNSVDWLLDAASLEKRSFYSFKLLRVNARPQCNGHAQRVVEAPQGDSLQCVCEHNTCGATCNECCPLFNDKPYQSADGRGVPPMCEVCQCHGHAERCEYDAFLGRGVCIDCHNQTAGSECEFCVARHFRPHNAAASEPCQPCDCDARGSDGHCDPMGGACHCRDGFQGARCNDCAPGHYGADCRRCECDARGTLIDSAEQQNSCTGLCRCKAHVMGDYCDTCAPGFYDLSTKRGDGCMPCWCSGVGLTCSSAQLQPLAFETLNDWRITDITRMRIEQPIHDSSANRLVYGVEEPQSGTAAEIYWLAPSSYLGNRLTSYGSQLSLRVSWVIMRGDVSGRSTLAPDVVLMGRNGMWLAYGAQDYADVSSAVINVTLLETSAWYHLDVAANAVNDAVKRPVTRAEFLSVLSGVEALLIRAAYHSDQVETALEQAIIYSGGTQLGGAATTLVEQCVCPAGYIGLSCEGCDFGYIRVHQTAQHANASRQRDVSSNVAGTCVPCPCNGHSNSCDLQSGDCGECQHNTNGLSCERCKVGYYGNPQQGTPHDCQRCACPLLAESNNFSPSCQLKSSPTSASAYLSTLLSMTPPAAVDGNTAALLMTDAAEYICTQCPVGYTGDHCEKCDDGYYGNPLELGSTCRPCECNDGPCDVNTGECIICSGNTEGWHCERCMYRYWGDPSMGCEPCDCFVAGSDSEVCDSTNGQCLCKQNFAGQKCDACNIGYAHVQRLCEPCNCDALGSNDTDICDPSDGQCVCKPGVSGVKCNECADGHFGLKSESNGCEDCQCHAAGSLTINVCDKRSGQCACLPHVTGRRCDKCQAGHWNLTQGVGCHDCACDPAGSRNADCNPWTGQCDCKDGVGGQRCTECTDGFFGFSTDGCQRCGSCAGEGQVCDPLNGRCICPPNSRGPGCMQCVEGTWGWQPRLGCRECQCDSLGAIGQLCHRGNGQCQCREGYAGRRCDACAIGYFGYPECRRCNCNADGSFVRADSENIPCDANGQCPCKALVVGLKCDTCMQSTFGISALNPEGCTRCFCFGRASECVQSDWAWARIRMSEARNLSVQYVPPPHSPHGSPQATEYEYIVVVQLAGTQAHHEDAEISAMNDLSLVPRSQGNVSIGAYGNFRQPLYFQLPPQFHGDHTSSYGGHLHYTLLTDNAAHTPLERPLLARLPLVQLHAHTRLVLDYFEYEEFEYGLNVSYKVPLHESYWRRHQTYGYNGQQQTVDRATLMSALQNIRHIFVRGSTFADFNEVILHDVWMDSAMFINGATNMIAHSVERCKCPHRYDGLSCQDPARGFYRWRNATEVETFHLEDLIGRAAPCHCNGRSGDCERETGICLNCRNNTGGEYCERCAEGFYGEPNSPHGCQSCPCPETNRNFAKGCTVWQGEVSCICKPGYTGARCDRCHDGYFGNPLKLGDGIGSCQRCSCNPDGIIEEGCHMQTGQCRCRPGVTGLRCDKCIVERHHLTEHHGCKLCDNCTLLLLDYVMLMGSKMRRGLRNVDLTSGAPAPHLKVEEYENFHHILEVIWNDYNNARRRLSEYDVNALLKLDAHAENEKFQARKAQSMALKRLNATNALTHDAITLYDVTVAHIADIQQIIQSLNAYGESEQHLSRPMALEQARYYLDEIQQHQRSVQQIRTSNKCAWEYFYRSGNASDDAYDAQARVEWFWRDLNQTNFRLADMRLHVDRTLELQETFDDVQQHIINLKNHFIEDLPQITELQTDVLRDLNHNYVTNTHVLLDNNAEQLDELYSKTKSLLEHIATVNYTLVQNESMQREARKHWLPKAQKHAVRLMERSNEYARQFQPTRQGASIALLASSAHKNISDAIEAARLASYDARECVLNAHRTLYPPNSMSIIQRAQQSQQRTKQLQDYGQHELQRTNALQHQLQTQQHNVEALRGQIIDVGMRSNNISGQLQSLGERSAGRKHATASMAQAKNISATMHGEMRRAQRLHTQMQQLREMFAKLEPEWEIKLGMAEENISLTKTNVRLANVSLHYLEEQAAREQVKFDKWNNSMAAQLQNLRDTIAKARHAAEGIKISVKSHLAEPKCVRSYLPNAFGLSTSNTLKISFALPGQNGNSPLVYVEGTEGHYIALQLYKRHVRLLWHLGGNTQIITSPLEVQTRNPDYDDAWYHVEVNRTLNIGTLLVRHMNNYGTLQPAPTVMGHSDAEHTRFMQSSAERIYLGGYPKAAAEMPAKELQLNAGLNVVVHNLEIDHKPIGIWNFLKEEGHCAGAVIGAYETTGNTMTRHFNGLGYAEVKKSRPRPYRKNLFALQMTFKTRDENALLFLAVDDKNNRSVSVTLSRGRILFRIDYGDESKLEINTTNKYNNGKWVKIEAAREFVPKRGTENGMLRVNSDRAITGAPTLPIKSHMLPDLSKPVYYLGGVPPGFKSGTTKAPGADNPFLGCMRDVQVNGETYDPLESSSYYGVESTCKETFHNAGFMGHGYVELPSQSLRKRANIGFVFRTLQNDCLLLLSAYPPEVEQDYDAKDIKGNYSFSLLNGHLQVWINSGRSQLKIASNLTLNDGEFHVINLIKNGRKFDLHIDDEAQESHSLQGTPTLVSMPRDTGGLYLGGAPPYEEYTPLAPTFMQLEGAIRDVVFNNRTVNFNEALHVQHVQIGRNGPAMGNANGLLDVLLKTEPMLGKSFTAAPEGCLRVGSYSYEPNAFKFGDEPLSYAQIQASQRNFWQRNFQISFDFRSFYPSGMIFLAPGLKEKQKHYVALLLKDGQLLLVVRGRRREELQLTAKLNDGEWHRVTIECHDRKLTMSVEIGRTDQKTSAQMKLPRKVAASHQILVGGLPQTVPKLPSELLARLDSFKGCLRRFAINKNNQDLARPGKHMHVGQCFPNVERGSYFPGDAYAIYKRSFHVGKYLELELEFRTSELSGILLSISEPSGFPALSLELNNGNIIFSCDLGDGIPFRLTSMLPSRYALCDNKWHNISALYDYEQLALRIDRLQPIMVVAPQRQNVGKVQTKSPLYIGGIPDIAPSGSLMSRDNFKGCIRNVSIRNERRDWIDMDALHNVLLSECLVAPTSERRRR